MLHKHTRGSEPLAKDGATWMAPEVDIVEELQRKQLYDAEVNDEIDGFYQRNANDTNTLTRHLHDLIFDDQNDDDGDESDVDDDAAAVDSAQKSHLQSDAVSQTEVVVERAAKAHLARATSEARAITAYILGERDTWHGSSHAVARRVCGYLRGKSYNPTSPTPSNQHATSC